MKYEPIWYFSKSGKYTKRLPTNHNYLRRQLREKNFLKKKKLFRPFSILYMGIVRVNCDLFNHYLRERKTEKWNQDKLTSYEEKDLAYSPWISVTVWLPRGFFFFFFFNVFSLFSQMAFLPFSFKVFSFFYQLVYLFIYMF